MQTIENCWRVETAHRAAVLLDSGAYFAAAMAALHRGAPFGAAAGLGLRPAHPPDA
ncbi:MAG: hypothetical protein WDN45_16490 [Caulobacteraceae bacterium]